MLSSTTDPAGPVFVSYRWSDGSAHAIDVARRLRASGVPVWLDRNDLPPAETGERLEEALASGISGAVLVATPDVGLRKPHDFIHDLEAPTILDDLAKAAELHAGGREHGRVLAGHRRSEEAKRVVWPLRRR